MRTKYTETPPGRPMVDVRGLRHSFGDLVVLDGVDLTAGAGVVLCLLGPNGAGKTTAVRIMSTLLVPDGGTVRIAGHDALADPHAVRARIGLTGQHAALDEMLTGLEQLELLGRLRGLGRRGARIRAAELLERFGLTDAADRRLQRYSGGMRRRLDLAASLVVPPAVLFLDEPTTGLDPRSRLSLWEVVRDLAAGGTTVVLTTQYLDEADHLADHIVVLDRGAVAAEGTAGSLRARYGQERLVITATSVGALDTLADVSAPEVVERDGAELRLTFASDGTASGLRALLDQLDPTRSLIARVEVRAATLDDVFLVLTDRASGSPREASRA